MRRWATRLERWRTGGSVLRRIVAGTAVVTAATILVKAVSLVKDMVVAHRFGAADELDAYLYALTYLGFVGAVVLGAFEVSFLPVYVRVKEQQGTAEAGRLLGSAISLLSVVVLAACLVFVAVAPALLPHLASGFGPAKIAVTQRLMIGLIPFLWWQAVFVLYRAALICDERFLLSATAPVCLSLGLLVFVGWRGREWGAGTLLAGTLAGYLAQLLTGAAGVRRAGLSPWPAWHGLTPELRQILRQALPLVGAMLINAASPIVDQSFAAALPAGSVAILGYGNKLTFLLLALTESLNLGVFPFLAQMVARRELDALARTIRHGALAILGLTIPLVLILILASHPIVRYVYERGEFTADVTAQVVRVQQFYLLQIPGAVLGILLARLLNATRCNSFMIVVGLGNFVLNLVADAVLIRPMGLAGIAVSSALVATNATFMLAGGAAWWFRRERRARRAELPPSVS